MANRKPQLEELITRYGGQVIKVDNKVNIVYPDAWLPASKNRKKK